MSTDVIIVLTILSGMIWIAVSKEAVKPSEKIKWKKMIPLLCAGTLSTIIITISLFQSLPLFR